MKTKAVHFTLNNSTHRVGEVTLRAYSLCGIRGYLGDSDYITKDKAKVTCKACLKKMK